MKKLWAFITVAIFSLLVPLRGIMPLYAQNKAESRAFYLNNENELIQKFAWKGNQYVYRYEFYLEKFNEETEEYEFETLVATKETELELPLKSGKYRYLIKVYNYLDQLDFDTEWVPFEIIQTYQPVITSVFPASIFLDEAPDGEFIVQGMNLRPETVFTIENPWYEIEAEVKQRDKYNQRILLKVNQELLESGSYYIRAVNPGGVFDTSGSIRVGFKKNRDLNVTFGYAPMLFPFNLDKSDKFTVGQDGTYQNADTFLEFFGLGEKKSFLDIFKPYGLDAKVTYYTKKTSHVYYGYGLVFNANWLHYVNTIGGKPTYTINALNYALCFDGNIQFILKKKLPMKITADIHAGAGPSGFAYAQVKYPNDYKTKPFGSLGLCANAGFTMQFYFNENLYSELGCDYIYSMAFGSPLMHTMYLKPNISMGWKF